MVIQRTLQLVKCVMQIVAQKQSYRGVKQGRFVRYVQYSLIQLISVVGCAGVRCKILTSGREKGTM